MNCGSVKLNRFIDLNDQPNGNHFPDAEGLDKEPTFPFAMMVCEDCYQVQIEEFPSPEFMFGEHPYVTGINQPVVEHFGNMAKKTVERFDLEENSLVIDIGCNDGTLLSKFKEQGMRVLGVDPGRLTGKLCRESGITVCETFWDEHTGQSIKQLKLRPQLITATAVFYHIQDIHDFIRGLAAVMTEDTVFIAQCVDMVDVLRDGQFDHFYHEHTMIHAVKPLKRLFNDHGMKIIDVEHVDIHGGSFIVYVSLNSSQRKISPAVEERISEEETAGLFSFDTYEVFTRKVEKNRDDLLSLLQKLKGEGKSVWALGAPLKGSTLLNYCQIGPDLCEKAVELNQFKIGKFTPGTHIPIEDETKQTEHPDYFLVLSWNFLEFFIEKYSDYLKAGGQFIVPNPEVRTIGYDSVAK